MMTVLFRLLISVKKSNIPIYVRSCTSVFVIICHINNYNFLEMAFFKPKKILQYFFASLCTWLKHHVLMQFYAGKVRIISVVAQNCHVTDVLNS